MNKFDIYSDFINYKGKINNKPSDNSLNSYYSQNKSNATTTASKTRRVKNISKSKYNSVSIGFGNLGNSYSNKGRNQRLQRSYSIKKEGNNFTLKC